MTNINEMIADKIADANANDAKKAPEATYNGEYAKYHIMLNSWGSGNQLHAYWVACLLECGMIREDSGKRTGRGGSIEKIQAICTPGARAISWHGSECVKKKAPCTPPNLRVEGDKVFINPHYASKVEQYWATLKPLIEAYRHMMLTGEVSAAIIGGSQKKPERPVVRRIKD